VLRQGGVVDVDDADGQLRVGAGRQTLEEVEGQAAKRRDWRGVEDAQGDRDRDRERSHHEANGRSREVCPALRHQPAVDARTR
jgi:hypothetical protein